MYDVECSEREGGTDGQWAVCGEAVIFLPASAGLTVTAVNLTWVSPRLDYRLSVRARNDMSFQQGAAAASSTAPIIIHRCESVWMMSLLLPRSNAAVTAAADTTGGSNPEC